MVFETIVEFLTGVLANSSYALIDILGAELLLSAIVAVDNNNNVKLRFDLGRSKFRSTVLYVVGFLIVGGVFYGVSNSVQEYVINYFYNLGWKVIPLFFTLLGFTAFYASKVILGRRWSLNIVKGSLSVFLAGLTIFLVSISL